MYDEAVVNFETRFPDAASSPGGRPPVVATVGHVAVKQEKRESKVAIQIPYNIRNASNTKVAMAAVFRFKGRSVPSQMPEFQGKDGSLLAVKLFTPVTQSSSGSVELDVPTA